MKPTPETRYSLIEKIRSPDDAEAWMEFTSIYQPVIFKICLSKGMQHADATDVTQEVLARVASAIDKFSHQQTGATFRGWLYRVTRNMVTDFFRQRKKNVLAKAGPNLQLSMDQDPSHDESLQFQLSFKRQMFLTVAKEVQSQVQQKTWEAFWQTEVEQKPVAEVCELLEMSSGAIYVARSRIIAKLRKEVQDRLSNTTQFFV